MLLLTISAWQ